jgi:hypothetical protein
MYSQFNRDYLQTFSKLNQNWIFLYVEVCTHVWGGLCITSQSTIFKVSPSTSVALVLQFNRGYLREFSKLNRNQIFCTFKCVHM